MTKRTIKETIREYDASGKLVRETITETHEEEETADRLTHRYDWTTSPVYYGDLTPTSYCDGATINTDLIGDPNRVGTVMG